MAEKLIDVCENLYFLLNLKCRAEATRYQYKRAFTDFGQFIGHAPTTDDLVDDLVTMWMSKRMTEGLAPITVHKMAERIGALWTWLAKRDRSRNFPTFIKPAIPDAMPTALSEDQLRRFFHSAKKERGCIAGVPADIWCVSYFAFIWNSSERKSAALAVKVAWVNLEAALCSIPPDVRKGGRKWGIYKLWPEVVALIRECIACDPTREQVWPWDRCHESYYTMYDRILRDAEIPVTRRHKTHALRVSHNTFTKLMTGHHSPLLGHSSDDTSRRHYEDVRFTARDNPKLFIPWEKPDAG